MKLRLKATKTKLYQLVNDKVGNLPKMIKTEFKSHRRTYWLGYFDSKTDHIMRICFSVCIGQAYLLVEDRDIDMSYVIRLSVKELWDRGMVEKAGE